MGNLCGVTKTEKSYKKGTVTDPISDKKVLLPYEFKWKVQYKDGYIAQPYCDQNSSTKHSEEGEDPLKEQPALTENLPGNSKKDRMNFDKVDQVPTYGHNPWQKYDYKKCLQLETEYQKSIQNFVYSHQKQISFSISEDIVVNFQRVFRSFVKDQKNQNSFPSKVYIHSDIKLYDEMDQEIGKVKRQMEYDKEIRLLKKQKEQDQDDAYFDLGKNFSFDQTDEQWMTKNYMNVRKAIKPINKKPGKIIGPLDFIEKDVRSMANGLMIALYDDMLKIRSLSKKRDHSEYILEPNLTSEVAKLAQMSSDQHAIHILSNPEHEITKQILKIFIDFESVRNMINKAIRVKDTSKIFLLGPYQFALNHILKKAHQKEDVPSEENVMTELWFDKYMCRGLLNRDYNCGEIVEQPGYLKTRMDNDHEEAQKRHQYNHVLVKFKVEYWSEEDKVEYIDDSQRLAILQEGLQYSVQSREYLGYDEKMGTDVYGVILEYPPLASLINMEKQKKQTQKIERNERLYVIQEQ